MAGHDICKQERTIDPKLEKTIAMGLDIGKNRTVRKLREQLQELQNDFDELSNDYDKTQEELQNKYNELAEVEQVICEAVSHLRKYWYEPGDVADDLEKAIKK